MSPGSSDFDRVRDPEPPPIPLAAQAALREARQGLLQKPLSHALDGPSPEQLGRAGSRARQQPPQPLSVRSVGPRRRGTPGIVPRPARWPGRARLCARRSGVLPPPRRPGSRHLPCGGPDALARAGARRRAVGRAEASGKGWLAAAAGRSGAERSAGGAALAPRRPSFVRAEAPRRPSPAAARVGGRRGRRRTAGRGASAAPGARPPAPHASTETSRPSEEARGEA